MSEDLVPLFVNVPRIVKEKLKLFKSRTKEDFTTQVVNALREYHEEEDSIKRKLDIIMQRISSGVPTAGDSGVSKKEYNRLKKSSAYNEELRMILSHVWDLEIKDINDYCKNPSEGQTSGMKMLQTVCMKVGISRQEAIDLFKWVLGLSES